jgi:hypothetical protein
METKMDGLQRLLNFLSMLQHKGLTYSLHHFTPDNITVIATLIGARIEVYFEVGSMTFSIFKGSEAVEDDALTLQTLFDEHWGDDKADIDSTS